MVLSQRSFRNLYRDSVSLMQLSETLQEMPGITQASAVMGSENNISLLVDSGLLESTIQSSPNELLIVVSAIDEAAASNALKKAEDLLLKKADDLEAQSTEALLPRSIQMSKEKNSESNLVLISTPGNYAAAEALKAMRLGMHVMMFSDNVSQADEVMLKHYSKENGLLFMGPDCGTAIINGVPLGFANVVSRGNIGIVAASGTGLQQVTCLIDRWGGGITQALGTGGHDLSEKIGGTTMIQGIRALAKDNNTKIIVLISKPPSPSVTEEVLEEAEKSGKPVVINFISADPENIQGENLSGVATLEDAATTAVALSKGLAKPKSGVINSEHVKLAKQLATKLQPTQKYIRGLFSGGTFCFETLHLLGQELGPVYSNIPLSPEFKLENVWKSYKNTAIDLGDDLFTQGRPHPMIDFRLRNERIIQEAGDKETAVILLDIVLGYGSNMDPAAELVPAIHEARKVAEKDGRKLLFIGSVCGTVKDPQNLEYQEKTLTDAGVILTESNAQATRLAGTIIKSIEG